jgi:hypothetical protein
MRLADLSHNQLAALPGSLSALTGLSTLKASHNALADAGVPWQQLCAGLGASLASLQLGHNQLTRLPSCLSGLSQLTQLSGEGNALRSIEPDALQGLTRLEVLQLQGNALQALPASLGGCAPGVMRAANTATPCSWRLATLRAPLLRLPDRRRLVLQPGGGQRVAQRANGAARQHHAADQAAAAGCGRQQVSAKSARARGRASHPRRVTHIPRDTHTAAAADVPLLARCCRRIKALPPQLLSGCSSLCTLAAHQNPITVEDLRAAQGYEAYEARWACAREQRAPLAPLLLAHPHQARPAGCCRRAAVLCAAGRRRQARASKQLGGRVMADSDRAFSEGADVEQWQRWVSGATGLGADGSGRLGRK